MKTLRFFVTNSSMVIGGPECHAAISDGSLLMRRRQAERDTLLLDKRQMMPYMSGDTGQELSHRPRDFVVTRLHHYSLPVERVCGHRSEDSRRLCANRLKQR
jgi:hypothetical protein